MRTDWPVGTFDEAAEGLRERADELTDYPRRLHVAGVQPADLLGSPKMSPEFWRWLTGSVNATQVIRQEVVCSLAHETADCPRCGGLGTYVQSRDVYTRPLARAIMKLAHAKPVARPHPVVLIDVLLQSGFNLNRAAFRIGVDIATQDQRITEEARFLSAIRALRSRYEETVLGPMPRWTEMSESQQHALTHPASMATEAP